MAISYVGKGTFQGNSTAIAPGLPGSLATDDLMIALLETANQAITLSGWTQLPDSPQGSGTAAAAGAVRLTAFYKFYVPGDSAPTTSDSGDHQAGIIVAFRGVNTTSPFEDSDGLTAGAANTQNLPSVTVATAGAFVGYAVAGDRDIATSDTQFRDDSWLCSGLDGGAATEVVDEHTSQGQGGGIGFAYGTVSTPGALTGATMRHAGGNTFAIGAIAFVLKPAGSGGSDEEVSASLTGAGTAQAASRADRIAAAGATAAGMMAASPRRVCVVAASMSAAGSISVRIRRETLANPGAAATGSISVQLRVDRSASVVAAGAGALAAQAKADRLASASLSGAGALSASTMGGGTAAVALAAAGTMSVSARIDRRAAASLTSTASAAAIAARHARCSASLAATGSLTAAIEGGTAFAASLSAVAMMTIAVRVERRIGAMLAGQGALAMLSRIEARSAAALSGIGTVSATGAGRAVPRRTVRHSVAARASRAPAVQGAPRPAAISRGTR